MLIINADDWGMDPLSTDRILDCFRHERISSTTAMMFMEDSERSAEIALKNNLPTGLHLNFTKPFTSHSINSRLIGNHNILVGYFTRHKYARILYNPKNQPQVEYCFKAQYENFEKLYGKPPTHIDGHHHIHLCSNLVFSNIIPHGTKIRRNFSFKKGEKGIVNRTYRRLIDKKIKTKFSTTDFFYGLNRHVKESEILEKLKKTKDYKVELMVHPGLPEEYDFIMSDRYLKIFQNVIMESYGEL